MSVAPTSVTTPTKQNEFVLLWNEGATDLSKQVHKYPLIATICMVAFPIFALMLFMTITVTGIISAVALTGLTYAVGKSIFTDCGSFWSNFKTSMSGLFTCGSSEAPPVGPSESVKVESAQK